MAKTATTELSEAKIRNVIWMLKNKKTKKQCCEYLGISYNTKKLDDVVKNFLDREVRVKELKLKAQKNPLSETQKKDIIKSYQDNEPVSKIAENHFISAYRVKKLLLESNIPIRGRGKKIAHTDHIIQDLDKKFVIKERVFVPRYNTYGHVTKIWDENWIEYLEEGSEKYVELIPMEKLKVDEEPRENVHYSRYWVLPDGSSMMRSAVENQIQMTLKCIEKNGTEFYTVYLDGKGSYDLLRKDLFAVVTI